MHHVSCELLIDSMVVQVDTKLIVQTQAGKKLRKLTKHQDLNIRGNAAELLNAWKSIVSSEADAVDKGKKEVGKRPHTHQSLTQATYNAWMGACPRMLRMKP